MEFMVKASSVIFVTSYLFAILSPFLTRIISLSLCRKMVFLLSLLRKPRNVNFAISIVTGDGGGGGGGGGGGEGGFKGGEGGGGGGGNFFLVSAAASQKMLRLNPVKRGNGRSNSSRFSFFASTFAVSPFLPSAGAPGTYLSRSTDFCCGVRRYAYTIAETSSTT